MARLFYEAHSLELLTPTAEVIVPAALLRYFMVIEAVARKVAPKPTPDVSKQDALIASLARGLQRHGSTGSPTRQIRNVAKELDLLEQRTLNQCIEAAGDTLSIGTDQVAAALRLARIRNTQLSHPGGGTTDQPTLRREMTPARDAAKAFMAGWLKLDVP